MNYQTSARTPSPPTVRFFHGVHVNRPNDSIGKLKKHFTEAGFTKVKMHSYGFMPALIAPLRNGGIVKDLVPEIALGDILVGHSNGGTIIRELAEAGVRMGGAVLINPAVDDDYQFPSSVPWVHVYFNKDDDVVSWSRLYFLYRSWGDMGRDGYIGPNDGRYTNFDGGNPSEPWLPRLSGHSDIFSKEKIEKWGPYMAWNAWRAWERDAKIAALPPLP